TGADLLDQPPDLVVREHLVSDLGERRLGLGARLGPGGGHHRALVPAEQLRGAAQVVDLAEAVAKLLEGAHVQESSGPPPPAPTRARAGGPARQRGRGPRASAGGSGPSAGVAPA